METIANQFFRIVNSNVYFLVSKGLKAPKLFNLNLNTKSYLN